MLIHLPESKKRGRLRFWREALLGLCGLSVVLGSHVRTVSSETPEGLPALGQVQLLEKTGDSELAIASRFAPRIWHETDATNEEFGSRADFLTSFDFDGDRKTANNRESLVSRNERQDFVHPMKASLYYAVVETESHWFITYHFYHALDWSPVPEQIRLGLWHENDGENALVVVRRGETIEDGLIELVALQAHNESTLFVPSNSSSPWRGEHAELTLAEEDGRPVIFVESGGHALRSNLAQARTAYLPAASSDEVSVWKEGETRFHYQLLSVREELWKPFIAGRDLGDGAVMDGSFPCHTQTRGTLLIPAFYDSDMLSFFVNKKRDSGVLPFRMGLKVSVGEAIGELFFHPAETLGHHRKSDLPWSLDYSWQPYALD